MIFALRDSGLLLALLGIPDESALLGHPTLGGSWEGFAMEEIIARLPHDECYFWATQSGAELDLLTTIGGRRVGFEYKVGDAPKLTRSMAIARHDLDLHRLFVVAPVAKPYTLAAGIDVVPLADAIDAASSGKSRRPTD